MPGEKPPQFNLDIFQAQARLAIDKLKEAISSGAIRPGQTGTLEEWEKILKLGGIPNWNRTRTAMLLQSMEGFLPIMGQENVITAFSYQGLKKRRRRTSNN